MIHVCVWLSIAVTLFVLYIESTDFGWAFAAIQYGVFGKCSSGLNYLRRRKRDDDSHILFLRYACYRPEPFADFNVQIVRTLFF